jgi:ABC-type antimicrobial peptide transport system permease subunit
MPVAVVNEHFAKRFWPNRDPIGRTFGAAGKIWTVVGVAKAGKYNSLNEGPFCMFYLSYQQFVPDLDLSICLKVKGDPQMMVEAVRKEVHDLDASVELYGAMPLEEYCEGAFLSQDIASFLLLLLGTIALALAAMGVYGVMSYAVSRRMQEFGIRMALGATRRNVLHLAIGRGLMTAIIGIVVGLVLASGMTRLLAAFLYGVSPYDPLIFFSIPLFLILVALAACWLPARRAMRVEPMAVLRYE